MRENFTSRKYNNNFNSCNDYVVIIHTTGLFLLITYKCNVVTQLFVDEIILRTRIVLSTNMCRFGEVNYCRERGIIVR